jgi:hypothetical protein
MPGLVLLLDLSKRQRAGEGAESKKNVHTYIGARKLTNLSTSAAQSSDDESCNSLNDYYQLSSAFSWFKF